MRLVRGLFFMLLLLIEEEEELHEGLLQAPQDHHKVELGRERPSRDHSCRFVGRRERSVFSQQTADRQHELYGTKQRLE